MDTLDRARAVQREAGWADAALLWLLVRFIEMAGRDQALIAYLEEEAEAEMSIPLEALEDRYFGKVKH